MKINIPSKLRQGDEISIEWLNNIINILSELVKEHDSAFENSKNIDDKIASFDKNIQDIDRVLAEKTINIAEQNELLKQYIDLKTQGPIIWKDDYGNTIESTNNGNTLFFISTSLNGTEALKETYSLKSRVIVFELIQDRGQCIKLINNGKIYTMSVAESKQDITVKAPQINAEGVWEIYDSENSAYVSTGVSARGTKGDPGPKGQQGEQGPKGPQGERGFTGKTGARGADGRSVVIKTTFSNHPTAGEEFTNSDGKSYMLIRSGFEGMSDEEWNRITPTAFKISPDIYYPIVDNDGNLQFVKDSAAAFEQQNKKINIKGPQGEPGTEGAFGMPVFIDENKEEIPYAIVPGEYQTVDGKKYYKVTYNKEDFKGAKGQQGEQGEQGPKGDPGDQGPKGNKGDTPVITFDVKRDDSIRQTRVDIYIDGKKTSQIYIPDGQKGERGLKGDRGDSISFKYSVKEEKDLPTENVNIGDFAIVREYPDGKGNTASHFFQYTKLNTGNSWVHLGAFTPAKGDKGDPGEPFTYDMFTKEQLDALKGKPFTFEMFTEEQLETIRGKQGPEGAFGVPVFIGENDEEIPFSISPDVITTSDGKEYYKVNLEKKYFKGDPGTSFTYEMFTKEQLEKLKGKQGDPGDKGDNVGIKIEAVNDNKSIKLTPYNTKTGIVYNDDITIVDLPKDIKGEPGDPGPRGTCIYASSIAITDDTSLNESQINIYNVGDLVIDIVNKVFFRVIESNGVKKFSKVIGSEYSAFNRVKVINNSPTNITDKKDGDVAIQYEYNNGNYYAKRLYVFDQNRNTWGNEYKFDEDKLMINKTSVPNSFGNHIFAPTSLPSKNKIAMYNYNLSDGYELKTIAEAINIGMKNNYNVIRNIDQSMISYDSDYGTITSNSYNLTHTFAPGIYLINANVTTWHGIFLSDDRGEYILRARVKDGNSYREKIISCVKCINANQRHEYISGSTILVLPKTNNNGGYWNVIFELILKTEKSTTWGTPKDPLQNGLCVTYDKIFDLND